MHFYRSIIPHTAMLLLGLIMCSCKSTDVTMVSASEFNASSPMNATSAAAKLTSGDTIEVSVEVDGRVEVDLHRATVSDLGNVTLPLIGDVPVSGVGFNIARSRITSRYEAYYVTKPVVMLSRGGEDGVGEWGQVLVTGRGVDNPGPVPLSSVSGIRLSAAIQAAGGFAPGANVSKIQVTRMDKRGRKLKVVVDFDAIGAGGNAEADILLKDGDIVNVPERIW